MFAPPSRAEVDPSDPWLRAPVLTAEEAYVGSLLWLDAPPASEVVRWLTTGDFSSPAAALIHRLVDELCSQGVTPEPSAVLAQAIGSDAVTGVEKIRGLALELARLYDHRATTPPSVRFYAANALDQAIRRRTVEMATRLTQVAHLADAEELERLTVSEYAAINQLRSRHRGLTTPSPRAVAV